MSDARCALDNCGRPTHDALICTQHTWELDRHLRTVPALLADLDVTLARQSKSGPATEKVKGKGEVAVAFNPNASGAATDLRTALLRWARVCGMPWAQYATTAAAHLHATLPELRTYGALPDLWVDVVTASLAASRAVDAPANRTIIPVGPCPEAGDDGAAACAGKVYAFIPTDDRPARMACDVGEGHYWTSVQWLRAGKRIVDLIERRAREARTRSAVFGQ